MQISRAWRAALGAVLLLGSAGIARADDVDKRLAAYEREAAQLGTDLPQPNQLTGKAGQRRLVDAEVAFSLGDYNTAALMLFDIASKPGADQETATYYLAEALYEKGDRGAARPYFAQVAQASNSASRYYQSSLLRLVEIAIAQRDASDVEAYTTQLDRVSPGLRLPQVAYVRGKYAYSIEKYDDAIAYFQEVPKGSDYELQAAYFTGTTYVAKKDINRATEVFTALVDVKPRTANDRRVIELSQLALGRLYYERDQPGKSIDSYLLVDRKSDLFPDALYEVAWVYVKGKQFDKALRALELLSLSEPQSTKTPTVRILEGNLRLRKAQMIRAASIAGTLDAKETDDPQTEYDKAAQVFTETHDQYMPSYAALSEMVGSPNPADYLAQIAGRSPHVFQIAAPIPEAAVQYLREEPEVQRVVSVETDLGDVQNNIAESEAIIARLEGVLAANDKTRVYPALQSRRARIGQIQDELIKLRADLGQTSPTVQQYLAAPSAEQAFADKVAQEQQQYDALDQAAAEVDSTIDSTQAIAVALRKYASDADPALPAEQKKSIAETLDAAAREAQAIEDELDATHKEITLGKDLAGAGDASVASAREARRQAIASQDSSGGSPNTERAKRIAANLSNTEVAIDAIVDQGVAQVKVALAQERANLAAYKAELDGYEGESRSIGGTVLGASFKDVKAKFYDIVVRTDVGNVDVSWSQKEDTDDDLKRLNLSRQRELKQLKDEFKDILEGGQPPKSAPKAAEPVMPGAVDAKPLPKPLAGSPDSGDAAAQKPIGPDKPATNGATVKPDTKKTPAPKKGGAK